MDPHSFSRKYGGQTIDVKSNFGQFDCEEQEAIAGNKQSVENQSYNDVLMSMMQVLFKSDSNEETSLANLTLTDRSNESLVASAVTSTANFTLLFASSQPSQFKSKLASDNTEIIQSGLQYSADEIAKLKLELASANVVENPYKLEALDEKWQSVLIALYSFTALTSFVLNAITVIVLLRCRRSELREYLINLSLSDLLMSLFSIREYYYYYR